MSASGFTNIKADWVDGDLVITNNDGTTVGTIASTGLSLLGLGLSATARTATSDGTGTGTIADGSGFIVVTSASANNIIVLPTPTPGTVVLMYIGTNGCELRSSAPASVAINGGTGASAESALAAGSFVLAVCTTATTWHALQIASDGTTAGVEAAA